MSNASDSKSVDTDTRSRDYITEEELAALIESTKGARYRWRDTAILMLMFYHGLRVSELCNLHYSSVNLEQGRIQIERLKGGLSTEQQLLAGERRALGCYLEARGNSQQPWLFLSERQRCLERSAINYLVGKAGERAGLPFRVHPHMLRHGCGYALANRGYDGRSIQRYLGHLQGNVCHFFGDHRGGILNSLL